MLNIMQHFTYFEIKKTEPDPLSETGIFSFFFSAHTCFAKPICH